MRVVSLNTGRNEGLYHARMALIAEGLASLAPDIVLLQECFASADGAIDATRVIAARLGMESAHCPARLKVRHIGDAPMLSTSGLAVLSRHPIVATVVHDLPQSPRDGERKALVATVGVSGRLLRIVNLHLTHLAVEEGDVLRQDQIAAVLDALSSGPEAAVPALIGGDLNAEPGSDLVRWLYNDSRCGDDPRGSAPRPATYLGGLVGARDPGKAIDYVVAFNPVAAAGRLTVRAITVAMAEADAKSGLMPSDHAAVVADVEHGDA
ncbi:MAG: endonuclease/exonuclease/phosphatase family protein [Hyphomicrobiaceae bacterium]